MVLISCQVPWSRQCRRKHQDPWCRQEEQAAHLQFWQSHRDIMTPSPQCIPVWGVQMSLAYRKIISINLPLSSLSTLHLVTWCIYLFGTWHLFCILFYYILGIWQKSGLKPVVTTGTSPDISPWTVLVVLERRSLHYHFSERFKPIVPQISESLKDGLGHMLNT